MFKFIFDRVTDPLGLPIEWYYEWFVLAIIGILAYKFAYKTVGVLYHDGSISGSVAGSFFHWVIRSIYFITVWAVTYGAIWVGKFVALHKVQIAMGMCGIITIMVVVKLLIWYKERKIPNVLVKIEKDENR